MKKLLMEFLGTFFLVLTVVMTFNPLAIASMLMAWLYIGCEVSGAHYNPMVSLAVSLRGKLPLATVAFYTAAQTAGALAAFFVTSFFQGSVAVPQPAMDASLLHAFSVEAVSAFVLALIVLVTMTTKRIGHIYGFAIAFTLAALIILASPISGGLFNPAVALGGSLFHLIRGMPVMWEHVGLYVGGGALGGVLAAYAFKYFDLAD